MRECFDEGVLQSYLDNELSPELAKSVAVHAAACRACADALTVASNETLVLANAFEAEMALDVPTVRLREQIDAAIARTTSRANVSRAKPNWSLKVWFASFVGQFGLTPQRALGFASVLVVIAFATIFALLRSGNGPTEVASNSKISGRTNIAATPGPTPLGNQNSNNAGRESENNPPQRAKPKKRYDPNTVPEPSQLPKDELARALPGEMNYLKAIDSLSVEIESSDNTAMKPSLRAEYERNLAVVDQAIAATRRSARRNPNDPDAAAFLYSSYQSKLDLLSAVAEQVRPTIATR